MYNQLLNRDQAIDHGLRLHPRRPYLYVLEYVVGGYTLSYYKRGACEIILEIGCRVLMGDEIE